MLSPYSCLAINLWLPCLHFCNFLKWSPTAVIMENKWRKTDGRCQSAIRKRGDCLDSFQNVPPRIGQSTILAPDSEEEEVVAAPSPRPTPLSWLPTIQYINSRQSLLLGAPALQKPCPQRDDRGAPAQYPNVKGYSMSICGTIFSRFIRVKENIQVSSLLLHCYLKVQWAR